MTNKLIRCLCGTMYDPARHHECPECGRAAVDQSLSEKSHKVPPPLPLSSTEAGSSLNLSNATPGWIRKGIGVALGLLLLAFVIKQCAGSSDQVSDQSTTTIVSGSTEEVVADCDDIIGEWQWFTGGFVHFSEDKNAFFKPSKDGAPTLKAIWDCDAASSEYTVVWAHGYTDTLKLSNGDRTIRGTNNTGVDVSGTRYVE